MAKRPPRHSALKFLCLAAFTASTVGSASGAHGCSHHDGPTGSRSAHDGAAVEVAGTAPSASGHAAAEGGHRHGPAANPAAHGGVPSDGNPGHGEEDEHGPCTCLGDCHPGAAVPLSAPSPTHSVAVADVWTAALPAVWSDGPAIVRDAFRLHLPNAPPARI